MNMLMLFLPVVIVASQYAFAKPEPCDSARSWD